MDLPVLIIGAGAAGLLAARELSLAGLPVIVLEAAADPGGRILTLSGSGFSKPVETGAEFIHGSLPLTLQLVKEAGIPYPPVRGEMRNVRRGTWTTEEPFSDQWEELMQKMEEMPGDLPLAQFLTTFFPAEKYAGIRQFAHRFAEGYDLADIHTASTKALHSEWVREGEEEYRVEGGYSRLIGYLADQCRVKGVFIHCSSPVRSVIWQPGRVELTTATGQVYTGSRLITTVSLGVLIQVPAAASGPMAPADTAIQSSTSRASSSFIEFVPAITDHLDAARQLGYGSVIKILMEFRQPCWNDAAKNVSFILSDEKIPTWWAQSEGDSHLLTGWLTGAAMEDFRLLSAAERINGCLDSLASIFTRDRSWLSDQLAAIRINDWSNAPFVLGGYSFETVNSPAARKILAEPVHETLYFAGEALYEGIATATVEAAFTSGRDVAQKIIAQS